jgi:hypothetical protein
MMRPRGARSKRPDHTETRWVARVQKKSGRREPLIPRAADRGLGRKDECQCPLKNFLTTDGELGAQMKVRDDLGIFWSSDQGQMEAAGIEFYGLVNAVDAIVVIDPQGLGWTRPDFDVTVKQVRTTAFLVVCVAVRVNKWPEDRSWRDRVQATLRRLVVTGAAVSWAGGYDCSWSPDVLNPPLSAGNVYAAYSTETGFLCNACLSEEMRFLDDAQLATLCRLAVSVKTNY